jgi:hypothetical protein
MSQRTFWSVSAVVTSALLPVHTVSAQHRSALRSTAFTVNARSVLTLEPIGSSPAFQTPRRPSPGARVAAQFVAASAGAVVGGLGGYLALRDLSATRVKGDEGYSRSGNVGYLTGSFIGTTLAAHLVGTRMGGVAPLWATSLGGLIGTVPLMTLGVDEPYLPLFGIALGWIPQAALATGGFTMAERR